MFGKKITKKKSINSDVFKLKFLKMIMRKMNPEFFKVLAIVSK